MAVPRKEKDNILWAEELTAHPLSEIHSYPTPDYRFTPANALYVSLILHGKARALPIVEFPLVVQLRRPDVAMAHAGLHRLDRALPIQGLGDERRAGAVRRHSDG